MLGASEAGDVLIVSDGKSHDLDVQGLARKGRRISVVLVGEDSLEARIGHLAALTGGEIFVASDFDIPAVMANAFGALRASACARSTGDHLVVRRGGLIIDAQWERSARDRATEDATMVRAVGALAASLRLPSLEESAAARLAEQEGLVTHLTSLVLVDEAGAAQEDLPSLRKVALPDPATMGQVLLASSDDTVFCAMDDAGPVFFRRLWAGEPQFGSMARASSAPERRSRRRGGWLGLFSGSSRKGPGKADAGEFDWLSAIDWSVQGGDLAAGDLVSLEPAAARALRAFARTAYAAEKALGLGLTPTLFAVLAAALLAESAGDRGAARVVRRILKGRRRASPPLSEISAQLKAI